MTTTTTTTTRSARPDPVRALIITWRERAEQIRRDSHRIGYGPDGDATMTREADTILACAEELAEAVRLRNGSTT